MRDAEIALHHRAGAADLVADQRPDLCRQHGMHRILDAIAVGLIARRDLRGKRLQRRKIAAGGSDGLGGFEDFVHGQLPGSNP